MCVCDLLCRLEQAASDHIRERFRGGGGVGAGHGQALSTKRGEGAARRGAVGRVFCAAFCARLMRGELEPALRAGFRALRLSESVGENAVPGQVRHCDTTFNFLQYFSKIVTFYFI